MCVTRRQNDPLIITLLKSLFIQVLLKSIRKIQNSIITFWNKIYFQYSYHVKNVFTCQFNLVIVKDMKEKEVRSQVWVSLWNIDYRLISKFKVTIMEVTYRKRLLVFLIWFCLRMLIFEPRRQNIFTSQAFSDEPFTYI